ncbi:hypothetical protein U6A24_05840 [Aquimarina gracilis]|uniref:Bacteriocin-like protein n=1 Tax=Aquimarina gracilis TaxID=874422 RepID=A0ABU5ZTV1_9FLAO|nr:hypothetical protein [Aquimarina gracilis]MEB3344972.1 hypothetical protein [Aquimarina gracilis]
MKKSNKQNQKKLNLKKLKITKLSNPGKVKGGAIAYLDPETDTFNTRC